MCGSMVDIQSVAAEIRRGIKKKKKETTGKNIMSASATQGGITKVTLSGRGAALRVCVGRQLAVDLSTLRR